MTEPPVHGPAGAAWECDGCGRSSMWTDDHMVYGSLKHEEEGKWHLITVTCSDGCRMRLIADGKLPAEGLPVGAA